jgi:hypothetical protein
MDVKIYWISTLVLLVRAYSVQHFTCKWLKNLKCRDSWALLTTQVKWTIVKYVMEV